MASFLHFSLETRQTHYRAQNLQGVSDDNNLKNVLHFASKSDSNIKY
jgi:hypothetical protein